MPVQFVNISKEQFLSENRIFKNCSLENCLALLNNQNLFFASPIKWKDPFESRFLTNKFQLKNGEQVDSPWNGRIFCTCMTETSTSEAYWEIYSSQQVGICFAIYRDRLLSELETYCRNNPKDLVFIGKVEYQNAKDILTDISQNKFIKKHITEKGINDVNIAIRLLLLKRNAYEYEDEIRIFIVKPKKQKEDHVYLPLHASLTSIISTITIDPTIKSNTYQLLKEVFETKYKFKPQNPKAHKVLHSKLYTKPGATIIKL